MAVPSSRISPRHLARNTYEPLSTKKYSAQVRLGLIKAVTLRAWRLGLHPTLPVNIEQNGDVLLIDGQPFPASIAKQRATLARRIQQQGFNAVLEALA